MEHLFILVFIGHWYLTAFCLSFFQHRYMSHGQFYLSPFWEKFWFVMTWLCEGHTYLSPTAYAMMHRMHHANSDTEDDPHSPYFVKGYRGFFFKVKKSYLYCLHRKHKVDMRYRKGVPEFEAFDKIAYSNSMRYAWLLLYVLVYVVYAPHWAYFLLIPIHCMLTPIQSFMVSCIAHLKFPTFYKNYKVNDHSVNVLYFDFVLLGEAYHNNHHAKPNSSNFGKKWHEIDLVYYIIKVFDAIGILKMKGLKSGIQE